ncbi:hypothetical protein H5410_048636 [Solanum commersonii]|uniref:Uncharacterized protein n=1 Tax=Solanum commersonii TaxID=4109 RepID=A0A9J5XKD9_SOLCO|nr:hypothetical protein H5410_048636 [Solanum commersonii]
MCRYAQHYSADHSKQICNATANSNLYTVGVHTTLHRPARGITLGIVVIGTTKKKLIELLKSLELTKTARILSKRDMRYTSCDAC